MDTNFGNIWTFELGADGFWQLNPNRTLTRGRTGFGPGTRLALDGNILGFANNKGNVEIYKDENDLWNLRDVIDAPEEITAIDILDGKLRWCVKCYRDCR